MLQTIRFPEGASLLPSGAGPAEESLWTISGDDFTGVLVDQMGGFRFDLPYDGGVALFNHSGMKVDGVAFTAGATTPLEGKPILPPFIVPQPPALYLFGAYYYGSRTYGALITKCAGPLYPSSRTWPFRHQSGARGQVMAPLRSSGL